VEDKTVEELQFHQQTVESDQNTPLQLIREKEIEISGRVLRAKREADEIIAQARREAAEIIGAAEGEGTEAFEGRRKAIAAGAAAESDRAAAEAQAGVKELGVKIAGRREQAVDLVLEAVARV
jgi:vacuolar-type H+-ATPase subunit H